RLSRKLHASLVHPGVSSFGQKYRTTFFPRKSFRDIRRPSSDRNAKSGAVSPTASIEIPSIVQASVRHNVTDSDGDRGLSCHCGASGSIVSSLVFLVASFM